MARSRIFIQTILFAVCFLAFSASGATVVGADASARLNPTSVLFACGELYFSEYVEGSSNNKALEIYNGIGASVDLATAGYSVEIYFNANSTPGTTINLTGSVANGDVYVVADDGATGTILGQADQLSGDPFFNGNDAVVLKKNGVVVDSIGKIAENVEWGSGNASTQDNTMRRKSSVVSGDTDPNDAYDPTIEWDGFPQNTFGGLGSHTGNCNVDFPPSVFTTVPTNGELNAGISDDIVIAFSEDVTVTGTWFDISCTVSGSHTASVSGASPTNSYTLNPSVDFVLSETCTVTIFAANVADIDAPIDNMSGDHQWTFQTNPPPDCTTIPGIQGTGTESQCLGAVTDIQGCITGFAANGFYYQDVAGDGNNLSSDAMFVYRGSDCENCANWQVGNLVEVDGDVIEFFGITEFAHFTPDNFVGMVDNGTDCGGAGLPAYQTIAPVTDPTADPDALYERYESMRAQMSFDGWVVGATKRFQSSNPAGDPEIAFIDFASTIPDYTRVFEDDYPSYQGISYLSGSLNQDLPDLDFGDDIAGANITGIWAYSFNKWSLLVDTAPTLTTADNPDVTASEPALNPAWQEFDVCYFNLENLFDHIDDRQGDWGDWAPGFDFGSGSSEGLAEYNAKLADLGDVIVSDMKSCMVIGVQEVEGKQGVYDDLAAAISSADLAHSWVGKYVESGDGRDISQGFLYRDDVTLVGSVTPVTGAPFASWVADGTLDFVRVPASATFRFHDGDPTYETDIIMYSYHFKSKRSSGSCTTPDCTDIREKEAEDMRDILSHHQTVGELAIGGGDLNDVLGSSPINILDASADSQNLYYELPDEERWSYVFNGESETLDYAFLTTNLMTVTAHYWIHTFSVIHVHADFPSAERASDHDPIRVRFSHCELTSPSSPSLSIANQDPDVALSWLADAAASGDYDLFDESTPFALSTPISVPAGNTTHTEVGDIGNPAVNHFYILRANNCNNSLAALSNWVGEFDFAIVPGLP